MSTVPISNVVVEQAPRDGLLVRLSGNYRELNESPSSIAVRRAMDQSPRSKSLAFDSAGLTGWDSRLVVFVRNCLELCRERQVDFRDEGLPDGMRRLLRLARAAPERAARRDDDGASFFRAVGESALRAWVGAVVMFTFLGQCLMAFGNLLRRRASFRWADT